MSADLPPGRFVAWPGHLERGHPARTELRDDGEVLPHGSTVQVVGLGAFCSQDSAESDPATHFRVGEFAVLSDGRRVVLHEERGFTIGPVMGASIGAATGPGDRTLGRELIVETVRNVVLPDDDDATDAHPYEWLAMLASKRGIRTTATELREVPYEVVLSEDLNARLGA